MSLKEYNLAKSQREEALRAIIEAKHDWKVPKQNLYPKQYSPSHDNYYGQPLVQAEPVVQAAPVEEEYEVEHIVEKRMKNGKPFYLVKWRGYSIEEATWEPLENLEHAPLKVKDFESMYNPLNETANLRKPSKPAEAEPKNKVKSPEPTVLYKTPSLEEALPTQPTQQIQPTMIMNPYTIENMAYRPMVESRGLELGREIVNENKNKKPVEKKATSNTGASERLSAEKQSQKGATMARMQADPIRKEGNLRQDDRKMNNSGNKGDMVVQRELIKPNENKGAHPHEKIKNISPEEDNPVVKMRKLNSDTRERNLMKSDGETYLTSPTSLGSLSGKTVLTDEEKASRWQESTFPKRDNFMPKVQEAVFQPVYQPYHQMLNPSNRLHTDINHIQTAYQRMVHSNTNIPNNYVQNEYPKNIAATTGELNRDQNLALAKMMQNQKASATPETDDHNADSPQRTTTKLNKKGLGEPGSFEKGDVPLKVMGIRPMPEINDLEILIDWKAREDGTKPYNSKVRRVDLLKYGHFMPLIEFYESKMRLETAPNFDPKLLTKY